MSCSFMSSDFMFLTLFIRSKTTLGLPFHLKFPQQTPRLLTIFELILHIDRNVQRHRAVSLLQHGFLAIICVAHFVL